jgi:hypothetical protein
LIGPLGGSDLLDLPLLVGPAEQFFLHPPGEVVIETQVHENAPFGWAVGGDLHA